MTDATVEEGDAKRSVAQRYIAWRDIDVHGRERPSPTHNVAAPAVGPDNPAADVPDEAVQADDAPWRQTS